MRLFVADVSAADVWCELTSGPEPVVRLEAADLAQARRARTRLRGEAGDVAVILDITVAVAAAGDVRSAYASLGSAQGVRYAGTVDGLAGLIADIESAEVADGVTLVPSAPQPGAEQSGVAELGIAELGRAVLRLLQLRRACA